ncbi:hypothetical protein ESCO_006733 [Escovopsis weberi]|uniref:Uncharacterized protein n=1 Tax=Escovopsis weberi TaxID=150374 RepID=A0A0M9VVU1_ESCWE|nr:hypothetical protein ESCO_006733 [Escovopsis weberi]
MAGTLNVIKVLIVPAIVSLTIFLLLTFLLIPFWRRYRLRYAQYLPLANINANLEGLSSRTSSLRDRIANYLFNLAFVSSWRSNRHLARASAVSGADNGDDDDDDDDSSGDDAAAIRALSAQMDGEELSAVRVETLRAWESHARAAMRPEYTRRLSRELEEGFRDDSDEEPDP